MAFERHHARRRILFDRLGKLGEDLDVAGDVALDAPEGQPDPGETGVELPAQLASKAIVAPGGR